MARLSVTWGEPRRAVVYPAAAEELSKLLGAGLSASGLLALDAEQAHQIGGALAGDAGLDARITTALFELGVALGAAPGLAGGLTQIHVAGAAMGAAAHFAPALAQTHQIGATPAGTGALTAGAAQTHTLAAALAGAGALDADAEQQHGLAAPLSAATQLDAGAVQTHEIGAAPAGSAALAGDVALGVNLGAAVSASAALAGDIAISFDLGAQFGAAGALAADAQQTNQFGSGVVATAALDVDLEVTTGASDPAFSVAAVSYTGNGSTQAITGVGFEPEMVIILDATDTSSAQRWVTQANDVGEHWKPGGDGFPLFDNTQTLSGVTSFDADGFTLGSNNKMNASGTDYVALCFAAGSGAETANFQAQALARTFGTEAFAHTLGTTPVWAWSKRDGQAPGEWLTDAGLGEDADLGGALAANADTVTAVSASDITLGADGRWNGGTDTSPLILFGGDEATGKYKTGTYTGTGGSNNAITGLGFQPSVVMIRSIDGIGASVLTGGLSPQTAFVLDTGNRDAAFTLDADGFTVNGSDEINRSGESFRYFAWV